MHHVCCGGVAGILTWVGVSERSQLGVNVGVLLSNLVASVSMRWCRQDLRARLARYTVASRGGMRELLRRNARICILLMTNMVAVVCRLSLKSILQSGIVQHSANAAFPGSDVSGQVA